LPSAAGGALTAGRTGSFATDVQGDVALTGAALSVAGNTAYGTLTQAGKLIAPRRHDAAVNLNNVTDSGNGVNDLIDVAGNLNLSGTINVSISPLAGTLASGTYRLFNYTGSLTGSAANFALPTVSAPAAICTRTTRARRVK
jgi:fibronectin-binding autotransporter adhesin